VRLGRGGIVGSNPHPNIPSVLAIFYQMNRDKKKHFFINKTDKCAPTYQMSGYFLSSKTDKYTIKIKLN
jgi:hypothetical protein